MPAPDLEIVASLCKRRGFIFQSSEIYGGLSSCWDYGPLGVELKRNVKAEWWRAMVQSREDVVGLECSILMNPKVWEASGHLRSFTDPLVECKECHHRFRSDKLDGTKCPDCGGPLTESRQFNMMLKTFLGPVEDAAATVYLRPETAQGMFVNFENVVTTTRKKIPFGIAQIGKSFRNEITPGNFIFRTREFEQMEMEFFCKPGTDQEWYEHWISERHNWFLNLGLTPENVRLRPHQPDELAHYSVGCTDVEYRFFPSASGEDQWGELEGIANRTDYDLKQHQEHSGKSLTYTDPYTNEKYIPYVIEPAVGADRSTLAFLFDSYVVEPTPKGERVVLKLHPRLAPIKAAILPLARNKPEIVEMARKLADSLRPAFPVSYDDTGSIGKLYARQDEVGTPYCVTVDHQSLEDNQVTVRDRDTTEQIRVPIDNVMKIVSDRLGC